MEKVPTERETVNIEVIADYPGSLYDIGTVISVYKSTGKFYATVGDDKVDYRDYPALFKVVE